MAGKPGSVAETPNKIRGPRGRQGSALVTIMVGFSVVAISAGVIVNLVRSSKRSAVTSALRAEFGLLQSQVRSILEQEESCRTAIGGAVSGYAPLAGTGTPSGHAQSFSNIGAGGVNPIRLYQDAAGTVFMDPNGSPTQKRFGRLTVTDLALISAGNAVTADGKTRAAFVRITVAKPADMEGSQTLTNSTGAISTNIPINVRLNSVPGSIISCSALSIGQGASNMPACLSDQALITNSSGQLVCVKVVCPPSLERSVVWPFDAAGNMNCVWGGNPP